MSIFKSVYSLIFLKGLPPLLFNIKLGVQLNKKNRNETVSYLNKISDAYLQMVLNICTNLHIISMQML